MLTALPPTTSFFWQAEQSVTCFLLTRGEFRKFLMVSKMGQSMEDLSLAERQKVANDMFTKVDDDGNTTVDFGEFFKFYQV